MRRILWGCYTIFELILLNHFLYMNIKEKESIFQKVNKI
jgi:hypothetical protein